MSVTPAFILLVVIVLVLGIGIWVKQQGFFLQSDEVRVIKVIDGDTIKVIKKGKEVNVRLLGVDTPETVHPDKPVQPYGKAASAFATRTLEGKVIKLIYGTKAKSYNRPICFWEVEGKDYGEMVLLEGLGRVQVVQRHAREARYEKAEKQAKRARVGVWS